MLFSVKHQVSWYVYLNSQEWINPAQAPYAWGLLWSNWSISDNVVLLFILLKEYVNQNIH